MKKSIKRFLLTFVVMLCSMSALAEYYTGSYGTNVTWSLDTETGLLKIIGSGEAETYDLQGRRTGSRKGLNIIRRQDGSVRKVLR